MRTKNTLGRLLETTREAVEIDDSLDVFLNRFLRERNWLVHRSWRTHREFLKDEQEFIDLAYRLSRLSADALEYNHVFAKIIESYVRKAGVTEKDLREISEEFTNVWRQA